MVSSFSEGGKATHTYPKRMTWQEVEQPARDTLAKEKKYHDDWFRDARLVPQYDGEFKTGPFFRAVVFFPQVEAFTEAFMNTKEDVIGKASDVMIQFMIYTISRKALDTAEIWSRAFGPVVWSMKDGLDIVELAESSLPKTHRGCSRVADFEELHNIGFAAGNMERCLYHDQVAQPYAKPAGPEPELAALFLRRFAHFLSGHGISFKEAFEHGSARMNESVFLKKPILARAGSGGSDVEGFIASGIAAHNGVGKGILVLSETDAKLEKHLQSNPESLGIGKEQYERMALEYEKAIENEIDSQLLDVGSIIALREGWSNLPGFLVLRRSKIAGIIIQNGGATSHAAVVSGELGIPCVVGVDIDSLADHNGRVVKIVGSGNSAYIAADGSD